MIRGIPVRAFTATVSVCVLLASSGCAHRPPAETVSSSEPTGGDVGAAGAAAGDQATPERPVVKQPAEAATPPPVVFVPASSGLPTDGMWKCDPHFADFNNDGFVDIAAIPRKLKGPRVWFGDGRGHWSDASNGLETPTISCGGGIVAGDANGDGHLDLIVADHCNGVYVYLGDGEGNWTEVTSALYPSDLLEPDAILSIYLGAEDCDVGDIDGDGNLDIVASASDNGGVNVYMGDGTGSNWKRRSVDLPTTGWAVRVMLADINDDGQLDIVSSHSTGPRVWLNVDGERWEPMSDGLPSPAFMEGIYQGLAVGDVNNDGRLDFAVANWVDGPECYLQRADGSWEKTPDVFPKMLGGAIGLDLGDLDGDGNLDVICSGRLTRDPGLVRGVYLLKGDGTGKFEYIGNSGLPPSGLLAMGGVTIGDLNSDGVPDVAAGTGLQVESVPNPPAPVLPENLLVWFTEPSNRTSTASTND
jgi:hypothetical protein